MCNEVDSHAIFQVYPSLPTLFRTLVEHRIKTHRVVLSEIYWTAHFRQFQNMLFSSFPTGKAKCAIVRGIPQPPGSRTLRIYLRSCDIVVLEHSENAFQNTSDSNRARSDSALFLKKSVQGLSISENTFQNIFQKFQNTCFSCSTEKAFCCVTVGDLEFYSNFTAIVLVLGLSESTFQNTLGLYLE